MQIEKLILNNEGSLVDVRTPEEFMGGNVVGSINISLQELDTRMEELRRLQAPLILFCASGGRSAMATQILSQQGIECCNAGSWLDVNYLKSQSQGT